MCVMTDVKKSCPSRFFHLECFSRHQGFSLLSLKGASANDLTYFPADKKWKQRAAEGSNIELAVGCCFLLSNGSCLRKENNYRY